MAQAPPLNPYIEASLYTTSSSREKWDACANLYSLLVSLDALERAYISSQAVDEHRYAPQCTRLLAQIKTNVKLVTANGASAAGGEGPPPVADVDEFMAMWGVSRAGAAQQDHLYQADAHPQLNLPLTSHRLSLGIPATLEHPGGGGGGGAGPSSSAAGSSSSASAVDRAKNVAETTQAFITLMDALKLNLRAKDQLHPLLGEAVSCWNRLGGGGGQGSGDDSGLGGRREKLVGWLITLNQLRASDEIDEDQARQVSRRDEEDWRCMYADSALSPQMLFDVEGAYQAWFRSLQGG